MNQWSDKDFVMNAVKNDGNSISKASSLLKADLDVVTEAVKSDSSAIKHADPYIQGMFGYKDGDEITSSEKLMKNLEVRMAMRSVMLQNTCFGNKTQTQGMRI